MTKKRPAFMIELYIIIYLFLFIFFYLYGGFVKSGDYVVYLKSLLPIIIAFTIVEGLRYNRGIDYESYALHYDHPETIITTQDVGFDILNKTLQYFGFDSVGSFLVYAFIIIVSVSILLKTFPEIWKVGFVMMLIALILPSEQLIRQFISISLIYCGIGLYLQGNKKVSIVIMLSALSVHYSSIIFIVMIIAAFLYKDVLPLKLSIPVFFIVGIFLPADVVLGPIGDVINKYMAMDEGSSYSNYVDRSDDYLNANASRDMFARSLATTVVNIIFVITTFIEGYYLVIRSGLTKYRVVYNLFVVGTILYEFFHMFELYKRLFIPAYLLWFIIASLILSNKRILKFSFSYYIIIIYAIAQSVRFIFLPEDELFYFIWDK